MKFYFSFARILYLLFKKTKDMRQTDAPADLLEELKDLFERADFVKFAKFAASDEDNARALPVAVRFVTSTYQAELDQMPGQAGHDVKAEDAGHDVKAEDAGHDVKASSDVTSSEVETSPKSKEEE